LTDWSETDEDGDSFFIKYAYLVEEVGGTVAIDMLVRNKGGATASFYPWRANSREECLYWLDRRFPGTKVVESKAEWDDIFWSHIPGGRPSGGLTGTGKRVASIRRGVSDKTPQASRPQRDSTRHVPVQGRQAPQGDRPVLGVQKEGDSVWASLDPDEYISPVQLAKELGIPPQYVYNRISKGRLKAIQGPKSKMVRRGDYYGRKA